MRILIIEDEVLAQAKLEAMLKKLEPRIEVCAKLTSVKDSIAWLNSSIQPDAAFVDIQLSDDHSFQIFRSIPVQFPVIFTTAFDKYLLESFEFNSIDYLLKPITEDKLQRSLTKIRNLKEHFSQKKLDKLVNPLAHNNKPERLVVRKGTDFIALNLSDVAYFYTEHKIVFAKDLNGRQFITDKNLSELEASLKKNTFFRINRKFLVNISAIEKFKPDHGKIRVFLKPDMQED
jgi:DNA-binding LytR/AlgR family response regulator